MQTKNPDRQRDQQKCVVPTVSNVLDDGSLVELVNDPAERRTALLVAKDGAWRIEKEVAIGRERLRPYRASNNLIRHRAVLLPSGVEEYASEAELVGEVRDFIHRYVALTPRFERIASAYVLLSWVYDRFSELPYLRIRGEYGSGKTRFLQTVGGLCRTPIFASGASTTAPLFHSLDAFRGTLVLDEADFRFSDEKAALVKILNNGHARGMPVLRCEATPKGSFNPRAFEVYGPKIVASRGHYDDKALESRFLTEDTGGAALRDGIPISLPEEHGEEAMQLRNKLLCYRIRSFHDHQVDEAATDETLEPRFRQIVAPLLSVCPDERTKSDLLDAARELAGELGEERGMTIEADVLSVVHHLDQASARPILSLQAITRLFKTRFGNEYDERITVRTVGGVLRKKLGLKPRKSHGVYVLPLDERGRLDRLYERYGLREPEPEVRVERVDNGDMGDISRDPIVF